MAMAKGAFGAMVESDLVSPCDWQDLDDYNKDALVSVAKRCYAVVALHGGAKLREIKGP
jgi:hypothetical protein